MVTLTCEEGGTNITPLTLVLEIVRSRVLKSNSHATVHPFIAWAIVSRQADSVGRMQAINAFDKEFQEQSDEIIFQTILAANFLDIKNLLELMCKKVGLILTASDRGRGKRE